MRARATFGWEVAAVLILKALGLIALYLLFFTPTHHPALTDRGVERHLFSTAPQEGDAR
jgi:hypothetical protein